MNKCIVCGGEFESKRADAKVCSSRCQKVKIKSDTKTLKEVVISESKEIKSESVRDNVRDNIKPESSEPYVIPMTRKVALEICKADANRGDVAPLTGELKRKVFSALHNVHDCRHVEV